MSGGENRQVNGEAQPPDEEMEKARDKLARAEEQLQRAERAWGDDGFVEALKAKTPDEKGKAFRLKLEIGTKLLMIENAQIALVASRVEENSQEFESAITDLGDALQTLSNVTRVLNATGSLLSLVGRVVAIV